MERSLEDRVRRLLDREDIRDTLVRYARGMDRHDLALIASAYHPDARDRHGRFEGDRDEVGRAASHHHALRYEAHSHQLGNVTFAFVGDDQCHTETYFHIVLSRQGEHTPNDLLGGRYIDRFERRDDLWRIARRDVVLDWRGEHAPVSPEGDHEINRTYPRGTWDGSDLSYRWAGDDARAE